MGIRGPHTYGGSGGGGVPVTAPPWVALVGGDFACGACPHVLGLERFVPYPRPIGREWGKRDVGCVVVVGRVDCTVYFVIVDLVGVELGALFASLYVAFLVLGLDAPKFVPFASRHQVPAHECQIAIVAPEEIAFVGPLTVIVCVADLYVAETDHDRRLENQALDPHPLAVLLTYPEARKLTMMTVVTMTTTVVMALITKWTVGGRWLRCGQLLLRDTDPRANACRSQLRPIDVPITLRQHRRRLLLVKCLLRRCWRSVL